MSKLAEVQWFPADAASEFCDIGGVRLYRFTDPPRCSVLVGDVWISAIFTSPEAALTWAGNWYDAEITFRKSNAGRTGNKTVFLGPRGETPMTTENQIAILTEAINKLAAAVEKLDVELRGRQATENSALWPTGAGLIPGNGLPVSVTPFPSEVDWFQNTTGNRRFQNVIPGGTK